MSVIRLFVFSLSLFTLSLFGGESACTAFGVFLICGSASCALTLIDGLLFDDTLPARRDRKGWDAWRNETRKFA